MEETDPGPRAPGSKRSRADAGRAGASGARNTETAMSSPQEQSGPGIGQTLKDARRRAGMDVKEAEDRTKIRARYLRALEAEDWEVLPAPAYVRGFLRTYGQVLGIDGAALADEYRRRHEEPVAVTAAPEPVLRDRRRSSIGRAPGSRPPSRGSLIAAVAIGIVVLLGALAILGSGDDDEPSSKGGAKAGKIVGAKGGKSGEGGGAKEPKLVPIDVTVEPLDTVQICLVGDGEEALIPAQVLAAGASERFDGNRSYRLDLDGGGVVRVTAGEEKEKLKASGNASFEADSEGIREIDYAGPDCP